MKKLFALLCFTGCMGTAEFTPGPGAGGSNGDAAGGTSAAGGGTGGAGGGSSPVGGGSAAGGGTGGATGGGSSPAVGGGSGGSGGSAAAGGGFSTGGGSSAAGGGSSAAGGGASAAGGGASAAGGGSSAAGGGSGAAGGGMAMPGGPACTNVTCNGHGTCYSVGTAAFCKCDPGYYGRLSNQQCESATGTACAGQTCNNAGTCVTQFFGGFTCDCMPGYVAYGAACVPAARLFCTAADGSLTPRGSTRCSADDHSIDVCADLDGDGWVEWSPGVACADGLTCSGGCLGRKCPDQPCPPGTTCVTEAHQQPLGVCVVTCDCMNCPNCGPDNADHRWDDEQESCGNAPNTAPALTACRQPCPNAGDGCIPYSPSLCWPIEGCFSAAP